MSNVGGVYEETTKVTPDQTIFDSEEVTAEISATFDSDDGVEMVAVTVGGWASSSNKDNSNTVDDDFPDDDRPSNERLLITAFISFMSFTICQTVAAFVAGSEAMMGDSAAMGVDALTYLFNLFAERRKSRFEEYYLLNVDDSHIVDLEKRQRLKQRAKRKMTLQMELIPPIVSLATLICVTIVVLKGSVGMLELDAHRDRTEQGDPNVNLMLIFSSLNLLLDIVNVCCFARAKHCCGYKTMPKHVVPGEANTKSPRHSVRKEYAQLGERSGSMDDDDDDETRIVSSSRTKDIPTRDAEEKFLDEIGGTPDWASDETEHHMNGKGANGSTNGHHQHLDGDDEEEGIQEEANLNMCSAYTHVFADTLRSIAVIIAAVIAEVADGVTSEEADATAAVVVSALILLSLLPLMKGLLGTCGELRSIFAEERDEQIALKERNAA